MSSDVSRELVSRVVAMERRLQRLEAVELGPQGGARVYNAAGQAFADGAWVACQYDTVVQDTRGFWDAATPTRFTADRDGTYDCSMGIVIPRGGTSERRYYVAIQVNGANFQYMNMRDSNKTATNVACAISGKVVLQAGDYVEFVVSQNSGAAQTSQLATLANMHHHSAAFYQVL
jgi:hypothetical protein